MHVLLICIQISALGSDPARVTAVSGPHEILTGRPVTMTCNIDAIPDATITWYKDGTTLPDEESSQLTIRSAAPADSGMYQCVVSNEHGDDVGTISLQVRDHGKGPLKGLCMCVCYVRTYVYVHTYVRRCH